MIRIVKHGLNEEGNVEVVFRLTSFDDVYKLPAHKVVPHIREALDSKLGDLISGTEVCNKANFPNEYTFVFAKFVRKVQKKVDTASKGVKVRRSRKTEVNGG